MERKVQQEAFGFSPNSGTVLRRWAAARYEVLAQSSNPLEVMNLDQQLGYGHGMPIHRGMMAAVVQPDGTFCSRHFPEITAANGICQECANRILVPQRQIGVQR